MGQAIILPLFALGMLVAVLLWQINALLVSTRLVDHTDQILTSANRMQRLLSDLETGMRGYLISGERDFLEPYDAATSEIDEAFSQLGRLVADNPVQSQRLAQMQPIYKDWQQYATKAIDLRTTNGDYVALVKSRQGKNLTDQLRDSFEQLISSEEQLRTERTREAQQAAQIVIWSSLGMALLVGLGLSLLTRRQLHTLVQTYGQALVAEQTRTSELDEQRERLHVTLSSIGDAVLVASPQGNVTFLNEVAQQLTGWSQSEAQAQPLQRIFHIINEHTHAPAVNPFERVIREGIVVGLANHTLLIRRDGTEVPIDDSAAPIKDRSGNIIGVVLVFRDIREQKRAEAAQAELSRQVEAQRTRLDNIISNVPGVVWESWGKPDATTQRIDFVSEYVTTMLGYTIEEWVSTPNFWLKIVHPDDREQAAQRARETFMSGKAGTNQFRWVTRTGQVLWVESFSIGMRDEQGNLAGMRGVTLDITARRQAELARERIEDQQHFLLDASTILGSSLEYNLTFAQLAERMVPEIADWCAIHTREHDETVRCVAFAHTDPATTELARNTLQPESIPLMMQVLHTGAAVFYPEVPPALLGEATQDEGQLALLRTLGISSFLCMPLTVRGHILGTLTLALSNSGRQYNDTDRALAHELAVRVALALDNARLFRETRDAVRAREQFLSIASHELKTPITSLIGYSDLLLRRTQRDHSLTERTQRAIRIMNEQALRLNRLVTALLDLSRIETGQLSIEHGLVQLPQLAERLVHETQTLHHSSHQITWECHDAALVVLGDELRLEQVVQNLLQNAIKYSPAGGVVTVQLEREGERARLRVHDEGIGIPEKALPNLFRRFYRAPNTEQHGISGMGVGLFVVREIVQLHGGEILVDSQEGGGTTFTLLLPLIESATPEVQEQA